MHKQFIQEKKHRLRREAYIGRQSVAFTACVKDRHRIFNDGNLVNAFVPMLARSAAKQSCTVPIYTFMPDHLHVLLLGQQDDSDLKAVMDAFKSASGWWLYRHRPTEHWQKDFWDHVVREAEGWRQQARYIAANPCRAGLCDEPMNWPYTGSIGYTLADVLSDAFW